MIASLPRTAGCGGEQGTPPSLFSTFLISPVYIPRVYWDLDIQTNAVIKHRGPSEVLPPHPEVELLRSQLILKLRQHYRELCQQREGSCLWGLGLLCGHLSLARVGVGQLGLGDGTVEPSGWEQACGAPALLTAGCVTWGSLLNHCTWGSSL